MEVTRKVSMEQIAAVQTPFYVYDRQKVEEMSSLLRSAISYPSTEWYYSLKANDAPCVLASIHRSSFNCHVESKAELLEAKRYGFSKILFNGAAKTDEELRLASSMHECTIVVDNISELNRVRTVTERKIGVGLRLKGVRSPVYKFGCSGAELQEALSVIAGASHLELRGLHFHKGSFITTPSTYESGFRVLRESMATLSEQHRATLSFVDIGGGFPCVGKIKRLPIERAADQYMFRYPAINGFLDRMEYKRKYSGSGCTMSAFWTNLGKIITTGMTRCNAIAGKDLVLCMEPGTCIVGDAIDVYAKVLCVKRHMVFLDVSRFIEHGHTIFSHYIYNHSRPSSHVQKALLFGPVGTANDLFGRCYQGEVLSEGDIVRIAGMGAYTITTRNAFGREHPLLYTYEEIDSKSTI